MKDKIYKHYCRWLHRLRKMLDWPQDDVLILLPGKAIEVRNGKVQILSVHDLWKRGDIEEAWLCSALKDEEEE